MKKTHACAQVSPHATVILASTNTNPQQTGHFERATMTQQAKIKNRRWLTSAIEQAKTSDVQLPWARGSRRSEWKAKVAARASGTKLAASA
ncbi:MAG: hypothetical protein ACJAXG_000718 [Celeribacter sp.]